MKCWKHLCHLEMIVVLVEPGGDILSNGFNNRKRTEILYSVIEG